MQISEQHHRARPESQVEQPESHDHNNRNEVPLNSSGNSLNNSVFNENQKGEAFRQFKEMVENMKMKS